MSNNANSKKVSSAMAARARARREEWSSRLTKAQLILGYAIVGVAAVLGFFIHPAVGVGMTVLAGARLYFLRRETLREQAQDSAESANESAGKPKRKRSVGQAPVL